MSTEVPKITTAVDFRTSTREQRDVWRAQFMEVSDPTGYTFAEKCVEGGYRKWAVIVKSWGCKEEIAEWNESLAVKLQAEGILRIATQRDSFQAGKWLADRGWVQDSGKQAKRSKKLAERAHEEVQEDMNRLGLSLVKKG